jgi:hypothetical protein
MTGCMGCVRNCGFLALKAENTREFLLLFETAALPATQFQEPQECYYCQLHALSTWIADIHLVHKLFNPHPTTPQFNCTATLARLTSIRPIVELAITPHGPPLISLCLALPLRLYRASFHLSRLHEIDLMPRIIIVPRSDGSC